MLRTTSQSMARSSARAAALLCAALILVGQAVIASPGQEKLRDWELRVCADPNSLPFSSRSEEGFENRIAEILSESLGADLTYEWWPQGPTMISTRLREGECDLMMGVPDGHSELLNTIAYYRSPFVFVYRTDSPYEITSLDDPVLAELEIGVQHTGIAPHQALLKRGLAGNVTLQFGDREHADGSHPLAAIVDAVAEGTVDVGLAWGPVAGYYADRADAHLSVVPVSPEIDPPSLSMVTSMTIGVRAGDEALRDRLNVALVETWPQIQEVLHAYSVPVRPLPRPTLSPRPEEERLRVGLVTPSRTGATSVNASVYDIVGEAARMGALLAESDLDRGKEASEPRVELLTASSPSPEAAVRAGQRLIAVEGANAIVGGLGAGQAEALSALAEQWGIPFFNIGSVSQSLRAACRRQTFHVEASAGMYLGVLVRWYSQLGYRRWFLVYEESEEGRALRSLAQVAVDGLEAAGSVVGEAAVTTSQPYYGDSFESVRSAHADAVLLLVDAEDQIRFLAQYAGSAADAAVASFPEAITQTRNYLAAAQYAISSPLHRRRVLLWETTLGAEESGHLNNRFISRWGHPMDPPAWAAYFALSAIYESVTHFDGNEEGGIRRPAAKPSDALTERLTEHLRSPDATFETAKGTLSFRSQDQQLLQPLYGVELVEGAGWGLSVSRQLGVARLVSELPPASVGGPGSPDLESVCTSN